MATRIRGFYGTKSRHFIRRNTFSLLANVVWFQHGGITANIPTIRCPQRCLVHRCPLEKVATEVRKYDDRSQHQRRHEEETSSASSLCWWGNKRHLRNFSRHWRGNRLSDSCRRFKRTFRSHGPMANSEFSIYCFRQAKQQPNETLDTFHTRLQQLAMSCSFADNNKEVKTQIIQACVLNKASV